MPTFRQRASDALLHTGIELAADRERTARAIDAAPHDTRGHELATSAIMLARRVDSAILRLSSLLRPRTNRR